MALFDRRLLAFFDDAGSGGTLLDQIADQQRALAELDEEMYRYRARIGGIERCKPPRDRKSWIKRSRDPLSALEKYGQTIKTLELETGQACASNICTGDEHSDESENVPAVSTSSRSGNQRLSAPIADRPRRSRVSLSRRESQHSNGSRHDANSFPETQLLPSSPVSNFDPSSRETAPSPYSPGVTWVQIDTLYGMPRVSGMLGRYIVEANWQGQRHGPATEPRWQGQPDPAGRGKKPDDERDCIVRQQLKLEPTPGANHRFIVLSVVRKEPEAEVVGSCKLDVLDPSVREVQEYPLRDGHGDQTEAKLKLRLQMPAGPRPSVAGLAAQQSTQSAHSQPSRRPSIGPPLDSGQSRRVSGASSSGRPPTPSASGAPAGNAPAAQNSFKHAVEQPTAPASTRHSVTQDPSRAPSQPHHSAAAATATPVAATPAVDKTLHSHSGSRTERVGSAGSMKNEAVAHSRGATPPPAASRGGTPPPTMAKTAAQPATASRSSSSRPASPKATAATAKQQSVASAAKATATPVAKAGTLTESKGTRAGALDAASGGVAGDIAVGATNAQAKSVATKVSSQVPVARAAEAAATKAAPSPGAASGTEIEDLGEEDLEEEYEEEEEEEELEESEEETAL